MTWQPVTKDSPADYVTVLAIHKDDLFPVPAFRIRDDSGDHWLREAEGPEDTEDGRPGKYGPLYREPTHWMPLPETPLVEAEAAKPAQPVDLMEALKASLAAKEPRE